MAESVLDMLTSQSGQIVLDVLLISITFKLRFLAKGLSKAQPYFTRHLMLGNNKKLFNTLIRTKVFFPIAW